ncbi:MAG TPA: carbohydrate ABC transporter permease [Trueperaceae bacterium]
MSTSAHPAVASQHDRARAERSIFRPGNRTRAVLVVLALLATIFFAFPFLWAIVTSIKPPSESYNSAVVPWLQFEPTLQNWQDELTTRGRSISLALRNSVVAATISALVAVTLGTLAGYSLSRGVFREERSNFLFNWFLSQRLLLPVVVVIPYLLMMRALGLVDNLFGLILAYSSFNLPLAVLIMTDFFRDFPKELEEAALIDGATVLGAFWKVALPLVAPGLIATFILLVAFAWNEFLFALVLTYRSAITLPVLIVGAESTQGIQFWYIAVRSLIAMVPPVLLVLFVQRYLVRGLTMGAVKG